MSFLAGIVETNTVSTNGINGKVNGTTTSSYILHPNIHQPPPRIVSGDGIYLNLENGHRILDSSGGPAVACIGHGNVDVRNAVARQMDQFSFCYGLWYANSPAEDLAKELITSTNGLMSKATIIGSGSEAIEAAMKLARQYMVDIDQPQRYKFIARKGSFHGTTLGALSLTEKPAIRKPFEPLLKTDNVSFVSTPNMYRGMRDGETEEQYVKRLAEELEDEFQRVGPQTVCAFVAETFTGSSLGCLAAPPGYFEAVRSICNTHGALLVLDEVICGIGRTGTYHAWQQEGIVPDIQTVAKGLAGGYAVVSMVLMTSKIVDGLRNGSGFFNHGHTHGYHAVACAAALEVQNIIKRDNLVENVNTLGKRLGLGLQSALKDHLYVGDIRGRGFLWAIEFVIDKSSKKPFPPGARISNKIKQAAVKGPYFISFLAGSGTVDGITGDHILISPPYNITLAVVDEIVRLVTRVLEEVLNQELVASIKAGA